MFSFFGSVSDSVVARVSDLPDPPEEVLGLGFGLFLGIFVPLGCCVLFCVWMCCIRPRLPERLTDDEKESADAVWKQLCATCFGLRTPAPPQL